MKKSDIALIGLGVMGENLALNMESRGFKVSVYNRPHPDRSAVKAFMEGRAKGRDFEGYEDLGSLAASLSRPRKLFLMLKAGAPVDATIESLIPLLDKGDVIIDGGNSDFHDTERRVKYLADKGLLFVGTGVSGGEEGALKGPSVMPGGNPEAWPLVKDILQAISAKLPDGSPCCEWMGSGGAGHFVKTVHNGIEYGDMQLISEAYAFLKTACGLGNEKLAEIFEEWNRGELESFLIEITARIMDYKDPKGGFLLDNILDVAGQKGTGKWTVMAALDEADPLSLITQAVYARFLSARKGEREEAASIFGGAESADGGIGADSVRDALYLSKMVSYAQGFSLLASASERYGWGLNLASIAKIWRNGCIIRARFLGKITEAYQKNPGLKNLLFDGFFAETLKSRAGGWRRVVSASALTGIAMPCTAGALSYFDSLKTRDSGANLIQAQRDYFGAHTYERTDSPRGKFFHTDWANTGGTTHSGTYNA